MGRHLFWFLACLGVMVLVIACGQTSAPKATVQWGDYAAGMQARIEGAVTAKDCAALRKEFDAADRNSDATKARTGHSNVELMKYIDGTMKTAGCTK